MVEKERFIAHKTEDGREQLLSVHIKNVQDNAKTEGKKVGMENMLSLVALLHDVGKTKPKFQKHIKENNKDQVNHSSVGAKMVFDFPKGKDLIERLLAELEAYVIAAHHGSFDCVNRKQESYFLQRLEETEEHEIAEQAFKEELKTEDSIESLYQKSSKELEEIWKLIIKLEQTEKENRNIKKMEDIRESSSKSFYLGCLERLILSMLIDSDWKDTNIFVQNRPEEEREDTELKYYQIFQEAYKSYEDYMNDLKEENDSKTQKERKILELRERMRIECIQSAKKQSSIRGGCHCLSIPTGGGKTLASLGYALEYCKQNPKMKRIIYISPFISVTEQNSKVIKEAIGNAAWVLEHHSGISEENGEEEKKELKNSFGETWEEPFIATTMCQLLLTLFSDKKQCIRRMHRLKNAVLIIDEVQSLPIKCIYTFNLMINFLTNICDTKVILCTATQPLLSDVKKPILYSETANLIRMDADREKEFSRVKITPVEKLREMEIEEIADFVREKMKEKNHLLIILNSKYTVYLLYEALKKEFQTEYLTTNLCAEHRSSKIDEIKAELKNKDGSKQIVISTSLIEAGVDISFQCVIRALAGLDSIAQAAGRCNRNGEAELGEVVVVNVKAEELGQMPDMQKGKEAAKTIIGDYIEANMEGDLLDRKWMVNYYKEYFYKQMSEMEYKTNEGIGNQEISILQLLSGGYGVADKNKKTVLSQAFKTAGKNYRPIDNDMITVLVPYGEGVKLIEELQQEEDWDNIKKLLHQLQRYTVNIYDYKASQLYEKGMIMKIEKGENVFWRATDVGRILRTFKIKKNVEVTDNGKIII